MSDTPNTTAAEIPTATTAQAITPGQRVRLIGISPACLKNLTGTTQATTGRSTARLDVLLDESSTEALRRDDRVDNTRKVTRPSPHAKRHLLHGIPTAYLLTADNDS
ncbi:hypothetical protein ACIQF5_21760 [Streptomyces goshikiensis]|uniref:hypothetical protein n=1 Tax=Streptomyces goshikiensis TaxID=1942 RepID=UPI0037FB70AF